MSTSGPGRPSRSRGILESVGRELKSNPPAQLARTARKFGAADAAKQRVAILLNKSRKAGASIPRRSKGGK